MKNSRKKIHTDPRHLVRYLEGLSAMISVGIAFSLLPTPKVAQAFENDFIVAPKPTPAASRIRAGSSAIKRTNSPTAPRSATPSIPPEPTTAIPAPSVAPRPATVRRPTAPVQEEMVDLGALDSPSPPPSAPARSSAHTGGAGGDAQKSFHSFGASPGATPTLGANLKFFFDFMYRSGIPGHVENTQGFDSFHQLIMAEYSPSPEFTFMTDLSSAIGGMTTAPRFFEFDYQPNSRLQFRWGRIWIPFDDMSPHNIFGGRINASTLLSDSRLILLPTVWADLGVGIKYRLIENGSFTTDIHGYAVNGFKKAGSDPTAIAGSTSYPNFSEVGTTGSTADNNNSKDFGARAHMKWGQSVGLGFSYYKGTYSDKGATEKLGLNMLGLDVQLRPANSSEIRLGYMTTSFDLDKSLSQNKAKRGGLYLEYGQKFGSSRTWKTLFRTGKVQADDRLETIGDLRVIGGSLQKMMGPITLSLEWNRDMKAYESATEKKYNRTFWAVRIVTAL
jgi:hypothetical protein